MSIAEKLLTIAENEQKVYNAGEWENLKNFQNYGQRNFYPYAFAYNSFPNTKILELPYEILGTYTGTPTNGGNSMFRNNTYIEQILTDATITSGAVQVFTGCSALWKIQKITVNASQVFTNWFVGDTELSYIRWGGEIGQNLDMGDCVNLDGDSIYDTIMHLYSGASGKTLTLSQTAVNNATFPDDKTWDEIKALKPSGFTISLI